MPKRTNDGLKKRCSCGRKKWPTCHHPWHFGFHHDGTEHRVSLDKVARARSERPPRTKADANASRDRLRADIRAGTFPVRAPEPETRLTVAAVCDVYLREHVRCSRCAAPALMEWTSALRRMSSGTRPASG